MRVSSVMLPFSSSGTLKSTLTMAFLPLKLKSSILAILLKYIGLFNSYGLYAEGESLRNRAYSPPAKLIKITKLSK